MTQTSDNVKLEIENHTNKLNFARDSVNQSIRTFVENVETYYNNYVILEEANHVKRLISLSKDELVNVNDDVDYVPFAC